MVSKKELRELFSKEWKKHYDLSFFREEEFVRKKCKICGRFFWTKDPEREVCDDSDHHGYRFIGEKIGKSNDYQGTWKEMAAFYEKEGHKVIPRYPVVARWRDDLYFTIASIAVFQPYVVRGEVEPPANPLIIPQPSLRFTDVDNVGISGRHFTSFVMVGEHAFNRDRNVVWKEEAVELMYRYLTEVVGVKPEEITFHEDVWAGGGNFGPSIEYFVKGLELGNIVFMQFEEVNGGFRELNIRVLDHGIGLSRFAWIRSGKYSPYEVVLPSTTEYMKSFVSFIPDKEKMEEFMRYAGKIDFEEGVDRRVIEEVERNVGKGFFEQYMELAGAYATADHARTLLFAINDGMFPSNIGGGYNLRVLARRIFRFSEKYGWDVDVYKLFELVAEDQKYMFPELRENIDLAAEVMEEEYRKYRDSRKRAEKKVITLIQKKGNLDENDVRLLYESYGITPEDVAAVAEEKGILISLPPLGKLLRVEKKKEKKKDELPDVSGLPKTYLIFYRDPDVFEFEAEVVKVLDNYVVLDKTAFYPEGGGQEADRGTLDGVEVEWVYKKNGVVLHRVKDASQFYEGKKVRGVIDRGRRRRLTVHHTATHIMLAAARRVLGRHVWQEGTHKAEDKAHIDISHFRKLKEEELRKIEKEANRIVRENRQVIIRWMDRGEAERKYGITIYQGGVVPGKTLRIVEIEDTDVEACGGTHVKRTGEVGLIKVTGRKSIADGIERIEYKAGEIAVDYIQDMEKKLKEVAEELNSPVAEAVEALKKFKKRYKEKEKDVEKIIKLVSELIKGYEVVVIEGIDIDIVSRLTNRRERELVIIIKGSRPNVIAYRPSEKTEKIINSFKPKGGGKGERRFYYVEDIEGLINTLKEHGYKVVETH